MTTPQDAREITEIPVIDFALFESDPVGCAQKITEACTTIGFFALKNHGIPQEKVLRMFEQVSVWGGSVEGPISPFVWLEKVLIAVSWFDLGQRVLCVAVGRETKAGDYQGKLWVYGDAPGIVSYAISLFPGLRF